ncbi:MAG: small basic protein [Candidatus Omnitrophota bacterium]
MTQHSSLKAGKGSSTFRSVLKRYEKIKELVEKEKWSEEKDSIYHLPKVKRIKFKVKKTKAVGEKEGETAGATGASGAAAPAAPAVTAAKKKEAPKQEKKKK